VERGNVSISMDPALTKAKTKVNLEVKELLTKLAPPSVHSVFKTGNIDWIGYACFVDGWKCTMKTTTKMDPLLAAKSSSTLNAEKVQQKLKREIAIIELLPWHPNVVKYLSHDKLPNGKQPTHTTMNIKKTILSYKYKHNC